MAVFDDVAEKNKLLLYPHRIKWIDRIPIPSKETAEPVTFKEKEPLMEECLHFLTCIKTDKSPILTERKR
jgi:UDP-2-acetamido-3-amino-2,3-dideoxy-glucuronate N-acetyltransferase